MKDSESTPVLSQLRVRGAYERIPTDTAQLARELSTSQNLAQLTADFDQGATPLRDVGNMITAQRTAILKAYEQGVIDTMAATNPEILTTPIKNLHERVVAGPNDQPIGHNFFVNAVGFLNAGYPWAVQFDEMLYTRSGMSLRGIEAHSNPRNKDLLLAKLTENPDSETMKVLAVYLADRSQAGEKYLEDHYSETLERAKGQVFETTRSIATTTGLRVDMLDRTARQLSRTRFGSFDHLRGLVTTDNSGAAGDYRIGSLRVEVQFTGNVQSPELRDATDAHHVITHELHHAGSAQTKENYRCGLQINGQGLEANEGMTEYLTQLTIGCPNIEQLEDGSMRVRRDAPYSIPVFAMLVLHEQFMSGKNTHFATLFNAYHGDVRDLTQLEQALDVFYQHDTFIANSYSRQR